MKLSQIVLIEDAVIDDKSVQDHVNNSYRSLSDHIRQWIARELINQGMEYEESIVDAANYFTSKIRDNRYQNILKKVTPHPKNILTLSLKQIKDSQSEYDTRFNSVSKRFVKKQQQLAFTELLFNESNLKIVKISGDNGDNDAVGAAAVLSNYARGTKWCVTDVNIGKNYLEKGPIYYIEYSGSKFLCHPNTNQLMDDKDGSVSLYDYDNVLPKYEMLSELIPDIEFAYKGTNLEVIKKIPFRSYSLAMKEGKRFIEAEPYILKSLNFRYLYAKNLLKARWVECEKELINDILKDATPTYLSPFLSNSVFFAIRYAVDVIGSRWSMLEQALLSLNSKLLPSDNIMTHIMRYIEGFRFRWTEAESAMIDSLNSINYKGDEFKELLIQVLSYTINYRGRWAELEQFVINNELVLALSNGKELSVHDAYMALAANRQTGLIMSGDEEFKVDIYLRKLDRYQLTNFQR